MNTTPEIFLEEIGTWEDLETGISTRMLDCVESNRTWRSNYEIVFENEVIGTSKFEYIQYCDTIYFNSIEIKNANLLNLGFMTRWLQYGESVMVEREVRRACSRPLGYAVNVFNTAGWSQNLEDDLGSVCQYYTSGNN